MGKNPEEILIADWFRLTGVDAVASGRSLRTRIFSPLERRRPDIPSLMKAKTNSAESIL